MYRVSCVIRRSSQPASPLICSKLLLSTHSPRLKINLATDVSRLVIHHINRQAHGKILSHWISLTIALNVLYGLLLHSSPCTSFGYVKAVTKTLIFHVDLSLHSEKHRTIFFVSFVRFRGLSTYITITVSF